jgi:hypothetical protein
MKQIIYFQMFFLFSTIIYTQELSYPIVDTGQQIFMNNTTTISEPDPGRRFLWSGC